MDDMTTPASANFVRCPHGASQEEIMTHCREENSSESETPPAVVGPSAGTAARARAVRMIRIAISVAAFEAIARTLPLGNVVYENGTNERGERTVWLARAVVNRLKAMRGPGESYSE